MLPWHMMLIHRALSLGHIYYILVYNCIETMGTVVKPNHLIYNTSRLHELYDNQGVNAHPTAHHTVFSPYWAVEIKGGTTIAREVAGKYGFHYLGEIMPGIYYFKQPRMSKRSIHHSIYYHDQLAYDPQVLWLEQQVVKKRVKRDVETLVNDPSWPNMWYLNRGDGRGTMDMNVREVWAKGYAGQGVVVTILDDGLETDHPDLKENYDPFASYDVNSNDDNPEPRYPVNEKTSPQAKHGTRCAGEVAAVANNGICGLGIAYRARIGGVRMLDGDVSDAMESRSLGHRLQHIDVYSASWGPEDDGKTVDGPGRLAQLAFRNGIKMGRGGRGSIFVWASGNGGKSKDNCNCDGYTNSIYTLGVSAVSEHGNVPWYAEVCSSTVAVTYSSGGHGERGVITTDLNHTCTDNHSGTSASAPLAAGICALTLSANPRLTWRDLQYLVVYTARPQGLRASDWRVNGVGRRVSHAFGYGLMDANAMVELALNWTNVAPQRVCEAQAPISGGPVAVRPRLRESLALTTDGCASAAALAGDPKQGVVYLEHVQAKVTVNSVQRGEIEIWLTSPSGTVSKLLSKRPLDVDVAGFHAWPFMSVHYWGERANGTWKLTVASGSSVVSIHDWVLILYGTHEEPPMSGSSHRRGIRQSPLPQGRQAGDIPLAQTPPVPSHPPADPVDSHPGAYVHYGSDFPAGQPPYFYPAPPSSPANKYWSNWYYHQNRNRNLSPSMMGGESLAVHSPEPDLFPPEAGDNNVALFDFELPPIIDPSVSLGATRVAAASPPVGTSSRNAPANRAQPMASRYPAGQLFRGSQTAGLSSRAEHLSAPEKAAASCQTLNKLLHFLSLLVVVLIPVHLTLL